MAGLLAGIRSPADVKALPEERLPELAAEIRGEIVAAVSAHGGHLSSNLGAVELSVALAWAFDPPEDKILFDVSHQCYAWKLLTGRAARFRTIRRTGGLSGFQKRSESPCDAFGAGHAGTAVSAALGLA
ncbi:MAG: 1-deoxy-D-xylulose-5-phosphate synthase, partial [Kiritimatiellae bacterium]|nr:1-deoxy-D-xylulose-5-phosphate synthase [Kiritimatiellia bacterium]